MLLASVAALEAVLAALEATTTKLAILASDG